jgi:hypothetical protein
MAYSFPDLLPLSMTLPSQVLSRVFAAGLDNTSLVLDHGYNVQRGKRQHPHLDRQLTVLSVQKPLLRSSRLGSIRKHNEVYALANRSRRQVDLRSLRT